MSDKQKQLLMEVLYELAGNQNVYCKILMDKINALANELEAK